MENTRSHVYHVRSRFQISPTAERVCVFTGVRVCILFVGGYGCVCVRAFVCEPEGEGRFLFLFTCVCVCVCVTCVCVYVFAFVCL